MGYSLDTLPLSLSFLSPLSSSLLTTLNTFNLQDDQEQYGTILSPKSEEKEKKAAEQKKKKKRKKKKKAENKEKPEQQEISVDEGIVEDSQGTVQIILCTILVTYMNCHVTAKYKICECLCYRALQFS